MHLSLYDRLNRIKFYYIKYFLILFFLLNVTGNPIAAQNPGEIILNENFRDRSLKELFDTLEMKYNLRVYYKDEWIKDYQVNRNFVNTPLIQALNKLFADNELTFRFYQDNSIVIFPESTAGGNQMFETAQMLIVLHHILKSIR